MAPLAPQSVLVIGAGELGAAVLRHLVKHPRRSSNLVSVLLRPSTVTTTNPGKNAEIDSLRALGINVVPGDIANDDVKRLAQIFKDFSTVIGCSGMVGGAGTQSKLAEAALASGVPRYIPWQFGVDYDAIGRDGGNGMFNEQLDVRAMLRGQRVTDWKIVSTGMFMSFMFEEAFGVVTQAGKSWAVNALGSWENQVTLTDVDDIGRCTAEVVWDWEHVEDRIVCLAGDTVSYGKLAHVVEQAVGNKVEKTEWTVSFLMSELDKDPNNAMIRYRAVFAEGKGLAWSKATSFNARRGIDMKKVEDWARENLRD